MSFDYLEWDRYVNEVYRAHQARELVKRKRVPATPKEKKPQPAPEPEVKPSSKAHGLIAGIASKIYCLAPDGEKIFVKERDDSWWVNDFAVHDGRLFDGGNYQKVYDTLADRVVAERDDWIRALVSHDGCLYDGSYKKIFDSLSNKVVAEHDDFVCALVSHDGRLFDGGDYKKVYDTLADRVVAERDNWIRALVSHGGRLFDGGRYCKVFDTLAGRVVAERAYSVRALVSHGGCLYDGGDYCKIFDTLNDPKGKNPLWSFDGPVTALASVPMSIWNELAGNGKVVK